jgi:hypothetical protein
MSRKSDFSGTLESMASFRSSGNNVRGLDIAGRRRITGTYKEKAFRDL